MLRLPEVDRQAELRERLGITDPRAHVWPRHVPYFYCGYGRWLQHSGYVRQIEEGVERFLAFIGMPIGAVLLARNWIPAVQDNQLRTFTPVEIEEELHTVTRLVGLQHRTVWDMAMDFYVLRDGQRIHTASARIKHAYIAINEHADWQSRVVQMEPDAASCFSAHLTTSDTDGVARLAALQ